VRCPETSLFHLSHYQHADDVCFFAAQARDARERSGSSALFLASYHGHAECIAVLLEAGADVQVRADVTRRAEGKSEKLWHVALFQGALLTFAKQPACMLRDVRRPSTVFLDHARGHQAAQLCNRQMQRAGGATALQKDLGKVFM